MIEEIKTGRDSGGNGTKYSVGKGLASTKGTVTPIIDGLGDMGETPKTKLPKNKLFLSY